MWTKVKATSKVSYSNGGDEKNVRLEYDYEGKHYTAVVANMGVADMLIHNAVYTGRINPRKHGRIRISAWEALRELNGLTWLFAVVERIALLAFPLFLGVVLYVIITI